ncbi:glycoside hydrolase family 3 N-terminal domain-containing protein [Candidatus Latescibacterota bacterium]
MIITITSCEKKPETESQVNWTEETFSSMTADMKIGQLFCLSIDPVRYFISPDYKKSINLLIRKYKPGAIYLSTVLEDWKAETLNEFNGSKLLAEIVELQGLQTTPLLVGADFEDGAWFWDKNATRFPYPMALGTTRSTAIAYRQGKITAAEAISQGINLVFAPPLNQSSYYNNHLIHHSYGNSVETISSLGNNFIKGCQESGIASCMKYFPSELVLTAPETSETENAFTPFEAGIKAGALSVLTAPLSPTSEISISAVGDMLRNKLGFKGLIVSRISPHDAHAASHEIRKETVLQYIEAGINLFIVPITATSDIPAIDDLVNDAEKGELNMTSIDASVKQILVLKNKLNLQSFDMMVPVKGIAGIGIEEYSKTASDISDAALTLIKNEDKVLPLNYEKQYVTSVCFADEHSSLDAAIFHSKITEQYPEIYHLSIVGKPDKRTANEVMRRVKEADSVLCSFFIKPDIENEFFSQGSQNLLKNMLRSNRRSTAVSFYGPSLINDFRGFKGFLVTYSQSEYSMDIALEAVFGKRNPYGKLPAHLSDDFPENHGLSFDEKQ